MIINQFIYDIFIHLVSSWVCRVYYSSIIVLTFSNVWLFVLLRSPIESSIISI